MQTSKANGVTGVLLVFYGQVVFRVYDEHHNFVDYDLAHSDLKVTIDDEDAFFYRHEEGAAFLDHSPETLGRRPKEMYGRFRKQRKALSSYI